MRKLLLSPMIILVIMFTTSCEQEKTIEIREFYSNVQNVNLQGRVRADFGDRTAEYRLVYQLNETGEQVTVAEPEEIAGITVVLAENGSKLIFDGLVLETGALPGTGLSPLEAMPHYLRCWREGYITAQGNEVIEGTACFRVVYSYTYDGKAITMQTWFDAETFYPVKAETYVDDFCVIQCIFEKVEIS